MARTVDDIASDFANAKTDEERAGLIREMQAVNAELAEAHLRAGDIPAYQQIIRPANMGRNVDACRVAGKMRRDLL